MLTALFRKVAIPKVPNNRHPNIKYVLGSGVGTTGSGMTIKDLEL